MRIVVDTHPLISFVSRTDPAHALAVSLLGTGDVEPLVPDPVLVETDYLIRQRLSRTAARALLADVSEGLFRRVAVDDAMYDRAVAYDARYPELDLGLADGVVMALAERERLPILTFDFRDFRATRPFRGGWWRLVVDEAHLRRSTKSPR